MLGVPAYFHPLVAPDAWLRLAALAPLLRFVIVNPHNGPGRRPDPAYPEPTRLLNAAGVRTVGYVDTSYGSRPPEDVAEQVRAYRSWYAVDGVFLDQAVSGLVALDRRRRYAVQARTAGARFVVLNPGAVPHPACLNLADLVITFEGPWSHYRGLAQPDWVLRWPATRFCQLVYGIPSGAVPAAVHAATGQHAGTVYLADGSGPNPGGSCRTSSPRRCCAPRPARNHDDCSGRTAQARSPPGSPGRGVGSDPPRRWLRAVARLAHARGLAVELENDLDQAAILQPSFDFAVDEQCAQYAECDLLAVFPPAPTAACTACPPWPDR
jgi:hypothetical protein